MVVYNLGVGGDATILICIKLLVAVTPLASVAMHEYVPDWVTV